MIGIDTNIVLRWLGDELVEDDNGHQAEALGLLDEMCGEAVFIKHVVVAETIWVLRRRMKFTRQASVALLRKILDTTDIVVPEADIVIEAVERFSEYRGDFSDHLIGAINRRNGCSTTYTFDKAASKSPHFSELQR